MKLSKLSVLNDDELKMIDEASLEILGDTGVAVKSREVLLLLEDRGLEVDHDRMIVRFDPELVKDYLESEEELFQTIDNFVESLHKGCDPGG